MYDITMTAQSRIVSINVYFGALSVITSLSLIPCSNNSAPYDTTLRFLAAFNVPAKLSNVLLTLSSYQKPKYKRMGGMLAIMFGIYYCSEYVAMFAW